MPKNDDTAGIFATYPRDNISLAQGMIPIISPFYNFYFNIITNNFFNIFDIYALLNKKTALADEIFGTMLLVLCVKAITDTNNAKPPSGFEPFFVGVTVFTIGSSFGANTGYAINPARDLGPRIFTQLAGWNQSSKKTF